VGDGWVGGWWGCDCACGCEYSYKCGCGVNLCVHMHVHVHMLVLVHVRMSVRVYLSVACPCSLCACSLCPSHSNVPSCSPTHPLVLSHELPTLTSAGYLPPPLFLFLAVSLAGSRLPRTSNSTSHGHSWRAAHNNPREICARSHGSRGNNVNTMRRIHYHDHAHHKQSNMRTQAFMHAHVNLHFHTHTRMISL